MECNIAPSRKGFLGEISIEMDSMMSLKFICLTLKTLCFFWMFHSAFKNTSRVEECNV